MPLRWSKPLEKLWPQQQVALEEKKANMVIAVSEESKTYRPEMDWLASELGGHGFSIGVADPEELEITDDGVRKDGTKVDLVYRFWELFDFDEVPVMKDLVRLVEEEKLVVTPPMKHFQEEKLSLALFGTIACKNFGKKTLALTNLNFYEA